MDKLKLDIQRFAADPPTAGNLIDEVCLHEYHQNIERDYAKKNSDNDFANLVVDSIRSKNIFNKANILNNTYLNISNQNKLVYDSNSISGYAKCKPNTTYTISKIVSAPFIVATCSTTPAIDTTIQQGINNDSGSSITITTNSSAQYIVFWFYHTQYSTESYNDIINSIQLEEGTTATTYAPYQNLDGISQVITGSATVNSTYISNAENNAWEKCGKVVVYHFTLTVAGTWDYTTQFLSNLPKPISYTRFVALDTSNNEPLRIAIDTNGNAYNAWSYVTPNSGHIIEGLVTYITSE